MISPKLISTVRRKVAFVQNRFRLTQLRIVGVEVRETSNVGPAVDARLGYANGKKGKLMIGDNTHLSRGVILHCYGGTICIENDVFLGPYAAIYGSGNVTIGEETLIAMHCRIVSSNHAIPDRDTPIRSQADVLLPVTIGRDVWLGTGVTILGGVTIGDGCVVGAGAVVTKDLPPYSVAVGIPAKVIRYREKAGEQLSVSDRV